MWTAIKSWVLGFSTSHAKLVALSRSQAVIEFWPDGRIRDANPYALSMLGYSLDDLRGQHHRVLVHPEIAASPEYIEFWRRLGDGRYDAGQYRRIRRDGKEIWLQASYNPVLDRAGRVKRVIKYGTDITQQKLLFADMEGKVNALGKSQAVIEFDLAGKILDANPAFLDAMGYTRAEIVGRHHRMFVEPEERESAAYRLFWEKLGAGAYDSNVYKRVGKSGRSVWIQASYNPIFDAYGRPTKVVKYATDITERVQCTHTLATAVQDLSNVVQSNAEQAQLASSMSREAAEKAEQSKSYLQDLVARLDGLGVHGKKISEITQLIDGIAFQTNLLAINAAIEAARAGQNGRGFAVVAAEVRGLAKHSAEAAKQIADLISSSVVGINESSENAREVDILMDNLNETVKTVVESMEEIDEAAQRQTSSVEAVRNSIRALT